MGSFCVDQWPHLDQILHPRLPPLPLRLRLRRDTIVNFSEQCGIPQSPNQELLPLSPRVLLGLSLPSAVPLLVPLPLAWFWCFDCISKAYLSFVSWVGIALAVVPDLNVTVEAAACGAANAGDEEAANVEEEGTPEV